MPPEPDAVAAFVARRAEVLGHIADAARSAGRDPASVRLVAVSKTVPADRLAAAVAAGLDLLGENRVQEAEAKAPLVPGARWHLVGPLQGNKARRALEVFACIQTVDSLDLARRLDRLAAEVRPGEAVPVLLQVNVDADPAKAGFGPGAVAPLLPELLALPHLRVDGLMTIGRLAADPVEARSTFAGLRELAGRLRAEGLGPELSMGMSDDYPEAVAEGATIVRVGRALFGAREPALG